jgi:hypothetical protein
MGWKFVVALVLVSVAAVSAWSLGEPEDEAAVQKEAVKHLGALRKHLIKR